MGKIDYDLRNYGTEEARKAFEAEWNKLVRTVKESGYDLSKIRIKAKKENG